MLLLHSMWSLQFQCEWRLIPTSYLFLLFFLPLSLLDSFLLIEQKMCLFPIHMLEADPPGSCFSPKKRISDHNCPFTEHNCKIPWTPDVTNSATDAFFFFSFFRTTLIALAICSQWASPKIFLNIQKLSLFLSAISMWIPSSNMKLTPCTYCRLSFYFGTPVTCLAFTSAGLLMKHTPHDKVLIFYWPIFWW